MVCQTHMARSPATASAAPLSFAQAELHRWALLVVGVGYWGNVVRTARHTDAAGLAYILEAIVQNGAFCAAAWVMVAVLARGASAPAVASRGQIAAVIGICLLSALPSRQATVVSLVALGVLFAWSRDARSGRPVAALLVALAADMAWTSVYVMPLHARIALLDARAVRALWALSGNDLSVHGNLIDNPFNDFGIEVLVRCASSYPLAGVWLAFVVTSLYRGRLPRWRDLPWVAASFGASIVLTEFRLSWMTAREADFLWLHEGDGVTLYTLAAVGMAVLFPMLAARHAARAGA